MCEIARRFQYSASTISRELKRNWDELGCIFPRMRTVNRRRVHLCRKRKIDANPRLRETVWAMVKDRYLPQQICGWLRSCYPGDEATYVCPERIYQPLFSQAKYES